MAYSSRFHRLVIFLFTLFIVYTGNGQTESTEMTNDRIASILKQEVGEIKGENGNWQFVYGDHPVMVITDESANRMRIFSPIVEIRDLTNGHMKKMLEANFHSALDAKYCMYDELVLSVFTHPLRELTEHQLIDATRQVVNLSATFGSTYQSTDLIFSPGLKEGEETPRLNEKPRKKS